MADIMGLPESDLVRQLISGARAPDAAVLAAEAEIRSAEQAGDVQRVRAGIADFQRARQQQIARAAAQPVERMGAPIARERVGLEARAAAFRAIIQILTASEGLDPPFFASLISDAQRRLEQAEMALGRTPQRMA